MRNATVLPLGALLIALLILPLAREAAAAEAVADRPADTPQAVVVRLKGLLKSRRATNEALVEALAAASRVYATANAQPAEDEARAEAKERARIRKDVEALFLRALVLRKVDRRAQENRREIVNIAAAEALAATGNVRLAPKVRGLITSRVLRVKASEFIVSDRCLKATFGILAELGDLRSLEWMLEKFVHTRSSPGRVVDQMVAAHDAMLRFENVPGALRLAVVERMVRFYAGSEARAGRGIRTAAEFNVKVFWDRLRTGVTRVLQHFSGSPRNEEGMALSTVREFQQWLRTHDNPHRSPWKKAA